jgi:hypothetical protein
MTLRYDKETDTLTITFGPDGGEIYEYEAGSFSAYIDDLGALVEISIKEFSEFVVRALAAGVNIDDLPAPNGDQMRPVWEDVESSMISAFKYDESTGTLDVIFNRSGAYQYSDVPYHVVKELRAASSKGRYMRAMIIGVYD